MNVPVYIINLTKDVERWRRIETSLRALGVSPIRINAIDGPRKLQLIRRTIKQEFATKHWQLTPSEIGVAISHVGIWKRVHRRKLAAVVLEDDVELLYSFKDFYFRELPLLLQRCDIVKFEGLFLSRASRLDPVLCNGRTTKLLVPIFPTLGAAGYALTPRGAEKLLRRAARVGIRVPIDYFIMRYDEHGAVYGETRPMMVKQGDFPSNIEHERIAQRRSRVPDPLRIPLFRRPFVVIRRGITRSLAIIKIVFLARFLRPSINHRQNRLQTPNRRDKWRDALSIAGLWDRWHKMLGLRNLVIFTFRNERSQ